MIGVLRVELKLDLEKTNLISGCSTSASASSRTSPHNVNTERDYERDCKEINPREKPQNGTQEISERPNRIRKGESPSRRESPTKKGCFTRSIISQE